MRRIKKNIILVIFIATLIALNLLLSIYKNHRNYSSSIKENEIYVVERGDSLWNIAIKHSQGKDVREYVYWLQQVNKIDSAVIYPGQKLILPKF